MSQELVTRARTTLDKVGPSLQAMLPKVVPWRTFRAVAVKVLTDPKMVRCLEKNPRSVWGAIATCAQLGLMPDGLLGEAYILPFGDTATLIPGWRGYLTLARRSGEVAAPRDGVVYEEDEFEYWTDLERDHLHHRPARDGARNDEDIIHTYAIIRLTNGQQMMFVAHRQDIARARACSKQAHGPAWTNHYPAMGKKTAWRRLAPLMPMSTELAVASGLDSADERGEVIDLSEAAVDLGFEEERPASRTEDITSQLEAQAPPTLDYAPSEEAIRPDPHVDAGDEPDPQGKSTDWQRKELATLISTETIKDDHWRAWRKRHGLGKGKQANYGQMKQLFEEVESGQIYTYLDDGIR